LLDSGEGCAQAAIRKLREETGWHGQVTHASDVLAVDAGCSSAVMRYATLKSRILSLKLHHYTHNLCWKHDKIWSPYHGVLDIADIVI
jgi:ADP-ribose pyrophosphatase YjhB (NUDIX family)